MKVSDFEVKLSWLLAIGGAVTSVIVLGWNANEPVNAPKLLTLGVTAFAALFFIVWNRKEFRSDRLLVVVQVCLLAFVLFGFLSILKSEASLGLGFFGVSGRNTGFLSYFCLAIVFASAARLRTKVVIERVLHGLFVAGVVNLAYFTFTLFGVELIPWNNVYNRVLGTFGNPNFVGAFMGLYVVLCFVRVLDLDRSKRSRILTALTIPLALFEIKESLASQGVVITFLGIALIGFFLCFWSFKTRLPLLAYSVGASILGVLAVAGALQKGPLSQYIYKSSVSYRGEYWTAGWNMGVSNPFFGVGFDSYGLWYRRARDASALVAPGKDVTANSAHNVFIDIFASGGFPLLFAYLVLTLSILFKIIMALKKVRRFDPIFVAIAVLWSCYQVQSIVSINQIGIAIWGWILGGLIVGYQFELEPGDGSEKQQKSHLAKGRDIKTKNVKLSTGSMLLGGIIGVLIASPPYATDVKWRDVLSRPNEMNLQQGALSWPRYPERYIQASEIYYRNSVPAKSLELAKLATEEFPTDFRAWYYYYLNPSTSVEEKERAKRYLIALDPLNPDFQ